MAAKREIAIGGIEVCDLAMEVAGGAAYFRTSPDRALLPRRPRRQVPPVHPGADPRPRRPRRPGSPRRRDVSVLNGTCSRWAGIVPTSATLPAPGSAREDAAHARRRDDRPGRRGRRAAAGRRVGKAGFAGLVFTEMSQPPWLSIAAAHEAAPDAAPGDRASPSPSRAARWSPPRRRGSWPRSPDGRFRLGLGSQVRAHIERRYGVDFDPPVARHARLRAGRARPAGRRSAARRRSTTRAATTG